MSVESCAGRSAQDVVAATLTAQGIEPTEARQLASHVISDLIAADWFVVARRNLNVVAELCGEST